jgi:DNA-binding IclR family transcriptional regulator
MQDNCRPDIGGWDSGGDHVDGIAGPWAPVLRGSAADREAPAAMSGVGPAEGAGAVRSVLVAVRVLEGLARAGRPLGVTDLARLVGDGKGRVHRHLATLRRAGLVDQDPQTERYQLSWRMFQLGQAAIEQFDLKRVAEPALLALRDATHESVLLAVPAGEEGALVVHALEGAREVSVTVRPGNRVPAHCSAQGRVMLAFGPAERRARVLAREGLEAPTPMSITDPAMLRARLDLVRERLWDTAASETLIGVNVLAAPVLAGAQDALVGSIGVVGSVQHVQDPPAPAQLASVMEAAARVSRRLGSRRFA